MPLEDYINRFPDMNRNELLEEMSNELDIERKALELACYELWKLDPMDAPKEWSEPDYFRKQALGGR